MLEEKGDLAILVLEIRYLTETMKRLMILVLMVVLLSIICTIEKWRPTLRGAEPLLDSGTVAESREQSPLPAPPAWTDEEPQDEAPLPPQAPTPATPQVTTAPTPAPWLTTDVPLRRRNRQVTPIVSPRQINECASLSHALLPGRNAAVVWLTCTVCRTHCSWGRREVPTFDEIPHLATVLRTLWAAHEGI